MNFYESIFNLLTFSLQLFKIESKKMIHRKNPEIVNKLDFDSMRG